MVRVLCVIHRRSSESPILADFTDYTDFGVFVNFSFFVICFSFKFFVFCDMLFINLADRSITSARSVPSPIQPRDTG